ncbi:hypothetical protein POTOM_026419 [Populus tomentosa]|uniref:Protein kinase domain-containing protein n=1 Tax=Populus tomentosa TaxID=118781 RepID=A0A8X7ZIV7_POPTO|nr:hypothetical protein POTOM_026419 [Populus tomentosa]
MASITVDELHAYHATDREIFSRLVINLKRNPAESLLVIAVWLWLEDKRYPNVIAKMTSLADTVLNIVANEAALCLNILESTNLPIIPNGGGLPFTSIVIGKDISLEMFLQNKFTAISRIKNFLNTVCARIFTDILQCVLAGTSQLIGNQPLVVPGFPHPVFGDVTILARSIDNDFPAGGLWGWDPALTVPENDRTMFLTFSRGFPVTNEEVTELFTSICGDCVVNVQMQENSLSNEQPLYAKMIMRTVTAVDQILCGKRVAKFRINGKHIWARNYPIEYREELFAFCHFSYSGYYLFLISYLRPICIWDTSMMLSGLATLLAAELSATPLAIPLFLICIFLHEATLKQASVDLNVKETSFLCPSFDADSCKSTLIYWQGSIPSACDFHLFKSVSGDGMHLLWHRIIVLLFPIARGHILESWIGQQKIDGVTRQIAVELDTYLNEFDPDGKHMGIGAISITNPVAARASHPLQGLSWSLMRLAVLILFTLPPALQDFKEEKRGVKGELVLKAGTGVFGSVYKGVVSSYPPMILAAKNISETSRQGDKAYLAEICTRGHMRHKNIVQLQGCLARLPRSDSAVTTVLPEVACTEKATSESDVYSLGRNALLEGVHRMLEGKHNEQQVKKALLVGLACLHPDTKGRPTIRKVEQILLKPNVPLMKSAPEEMVLDKIITHHEDCDMWNWVPGGVKDRILLHS